jgi:MinD-like ATPase involved in chromosome partitioning or flagellar assembly
VKADSQSLDASRSKLSLALRLASEIRKPKDWQAFQRYCAILFQEELGDPHAQEYGRNGQDQHGIDILGRRNGDPNHYVGIQCRLIEKPDSEGKILKDCRAALKIKASLKEIIFATSAPNDTRATDAAISVEHTLRSEGHDLRVVVLGWADLQTKIACHPRAHLAFDSTISELPWRPENIDALNNPEPFTLSERAEAEAALAKTAPTLLDWPQTLTDGTWIERPELDELLARISGEPYSVTVLLGGPGSGKSALLARLGHQLGALQETVVLAIKADQLSPNIDDEQKLASAMGMEGALTDVVKRLAATDRVVVLIDQMDALADIADLRSRRLSVLLDVIKNLAKTPQIHVVASSRNFEYRHDPRFLQIEAKELDLKPPLWKEAQTILAAAGIPADHWPPDRQEAMRMPQALSVFLDLARELGSAGLVAPTYQGMLDQIWETDFPTSLFKSSSRRWPGRWRRPKNSLSR